MSPSFAARLLMTLTLCQTCTELFGCPTGWPEYNKHCYFFGNDPKTWRDARLECAFKGAHLTSILDQREQDWLQSRKESARAWIGLRRETTRRPWQWADGTPFYYSSWSGGEPNNWHGNVENCVEMWPLGNWNDLPCGYPMPYICKRPVSPTTTTAKPVTCPTPAPCPTTAKPVTCPTPAPCPTTTTAKPATCPTTAPCPICPATTKPATCPTPAPCPTTTTAKPVTCPAPAPCSTTTTAKPATCPTPAPCPICPATTKPATCPAPCPTTAKPVTCPTVPCPTPAPAPTTAKPATCPTPAPCPTTTPAKPVTCPTPAPCPTTTTPAKPVTCPTPAPAPTTVKPATCPTPAPCSTTTAKPATSPAGPPPTDGELEMCAISTTDKACSSHNVTCSCLLAMIANPMGGFQAVLHGLSVARSIVIRGQSNAKAKRLVVNLDGRDANGKNATAALHLNVDLESQTFTLNSGETGDLPRGRPFGAGLPFKIVIKCGGMGTFHLDFNDELQLDFAGPQLDIGSINWLEVWQVMLSSVQLM